MSVSLLLLLDSAAAQSMQERDLCLFVCGGCHVCGVESLCVCNTNSNKTSRDLRLNSVCTLTAKRANVCCTTEDV
jgi:hypothetical protein